MESSALASPDVDPKAIALRLVNAIADGDAETLESCLADDATWQVMGADYMPSNGLYVGKQAIMGDLIGTMVTVFDIETFHIDVKNVIEDGSTVVVEWRLTVQTTHGRSYENVDYCVVFNVANGTVRTIHEYTNTRYAQRVLFGPGD